MKSAAVVQALLEVQALEEPLESVYRSDRFTVTFEVAADEFVLMTSAFAEPVDDVLVNVKPSKLRLLAWTTTVVPADENVQGEEVGVPAQTNETGDEEHDAVCVSVNVCAP
jgi:hypothetical protein